MIERIETTDITNVFRKAWSERKSEPRQIYYLRGVNYVVGVNNEDGQFTLSRHSGRDEVPWEVESAILQRLKESFSSGALDFSNGQLHISEVEDADGFATELSAFNDVFLV